MANFVYTQGKYLLYKGDIDLDVDDIRVLLVGTTSTADAEPGAANLAAFTTLGESAGTGYARVALANLLVRISGSNVEFDADDANWASLDVGTVKGALVYKHVTSDADSIPLIWFDSTSGAPTFPFPTNTSPVTLAFAATGLMVS